MKKRCAIYSHTSTFWFLSQHFLQNLILFSFSPFKMIWQSSNSFLIQMVFILESLKIHTFFFHRDVIMNMTIILIVVMDEQKTMSGICIVFWNWKDLIMNHHSKSNLLFLSFAQKLNSNVIWLTFLRIKHACEFDDKLIYFIMNKTPKIR